MIVRIGSRDLPGSQLDELLQAYPRSEADCSFARWHGGALLDASGRIPRPASETRYGRYFGEDYEIKWRRLANGFRVVLLVEEASDIGSEWTADQKVRSHDDRDFLLRGRHIWQAVSASAPERLKLTVRSYRLTNKGAVQRWVGLVDADRG